MSCHQWIHFIKCNKSTKSEYAALIEENEDIPWYCVKCTVSERVEMFPFLFLDNNEMNDLRHIDIISLLDLMNYSQNFQECLTYQMQIMRITLSIR